MDVTVGNRVGVEFPVSTISQVQHSLCEIFNRNSHIHIRGELEYGLLDQSEGGSSLVDVRDSEFSAFDDSPRELLGSRD